MKRIIKRSGESLDSLLSRYKVARGREKLKETIRKNTVYEKPSERKRRKHSEALRRMNRKRSSSKNETAYKAF